MYQNQNQEIRTSAHLAQSMTMLVMSADEIREKIESEISKNPALELIDERICPTCKRKLSESGFCPACSNPKPNHKNENIVFVSPRDDFRALSYANYSEPFHDEPDYDSAQHDDLATFVLRQIGPDLEEDQKLIAAFLLNSLDEDGFITISEMEIANYFHVPIAKVEEVIELIHHAEPLGVGSRNPQEALLTQLTNLQDTVSVPPHTAEIIQKHYDLMIRGRYKEISKQCAIPLKQVRIVEKFIGENLNPFPARAHWGESLSANDHDARAFHYPDILIYYLNDENKDQLVIEIIMPISGYLQINPAFKNEIKNAPEGKAEEWKNDLDQAAMLVKCLYQRNNTLVRLMEILAEKQIEFIKHGDGAILPITRAEIAKELNLHESTISRAVANKTVMLPNRKIISLGAFFDRSLNVRSIIKDLVKSESKPLTDAKIACELRGRGFEVARRTVAKYRAMEGILPAHLRNV